MKPVTSSASFLKILNEDKYEWQRENVFTVSFTSSRIRMTRKDFG